MLPLNVETTEYPGERDYRTLLHGLLAHNEPFLGPSDYRRLGVFAREARQLLGGLVGHTGRGWLYIDLFWVTAPARGRGVGSQVLAAAELEAQRRGCHSAWLDTYDFQARPFYEKQGYVVFAEQGGYPNGHRRFFLNKQLAH